MRTSEHGIKVRPARDGDGYGLKLTGVWPERLKLAARLRRIPPAQYIEELLTKHLVEELLDRRPRTLPMRDARIATGEDFREICKR